MPTHTIAPHGFIPPIITPDHYIFGAQMVPKVVRQSDRQWLDFIPAGEPQFNGSFETYGCTVFGTLNAREVLCKRAFGKDENNSDRFTYISSDTNPPGNDPHVVAESIRTEGVVPEEELPFTADIIDLQTFRNMGDKGPDLISEGLEETKKILFLHEWLWSDPNISISDKQEKMWECLQYSPLGVSVHAWEQDENGLYSKNPGDEDNHWVVIIGGVFGKCWLVYDSYPTTEGSYLKKLAWDYNFGWSKRYHMESIGVPIDGSAVIPKENWLSNLWKLLVNLITHHE